MKNLINKIDYKSIKDNLPFIILIPTFLGGLWQIMELSIISLSLIRFFSVTQLIADGILILFILLIFIIAFIFITKSVSSNKDKFELTINLISSIIILSLLIYGQIYHSEKIKISNILHSIIISTLILNIFLISFKLFFPKILTPILEFIKDNSFLSIIFSVFICSIFFTFISYGMASFHNQFTLPNNWKNLDRIESKIKLDNVNMTTYNIQYFNDKYIFIQIKQKSEPNTLQILKFDDFFDE